jgi:hypothetical protein
MNTNLAGISAAPIGTPTDSAAKAAITRLTAWVSRPRFMFGRLVASRMS